MKGQLGAVLKGCEGLVLFRREGVEQTSQKISDLVGKRFRSNDALIRCLMMERTGFLERSEQWSFAWHVGFRCSWAGELVEIGLSHGVVERVEEEREGARRWVELQDLRETHF